MQQRPLEGQVMLAVGGAGGIGSAICRAYAEAGAKVLVGYHSNAASGEEAVASLSGEGHEALQIEAEDSASLATLAGDIEARHGRLDVLINLAGYTQFVPHDDLDALTDEIIDTVFRVNWRCTFATIRACKARRVTAALSSTSRPSPARRPWARTSPIVPPRPPWIP